MQIDKHYDNLPAALLFLPDFCSPLSSSWFRASASELGRWKSNKTEHATITYGNVQPFASSQGANHLPQHVLLIIIKFIPRRLISWLCFTKALPYSPQSSLFDTQCTNIVALRKAVRPSVGGSTYPMVDKWKAHNQNTSQYIVRWDYVNINRLYTPEQYQHFCFEPPAINYEVETQPALYIGHSSHTNCLSSSYSDFCSSCSWYCRYPVEDSKVLLTQNINLSYIDTVSLIAFLALFMLFSPPRRLNWQLTV